MLPQIRDNGRLVNVSSMAGMLKKYTEPIRKDFQTAASKDDPKDVTKLMERFSTTVLGDNKDQWPKAAYCVSKAGVTAMTKCYANKSGKRVLINACCPGYVNTDMTKGNGVKTVEQGAETPVLLAVGDIGNTTGEFWQEKQVSEW